MASSRFILGVVVSGGFHVLAFLQMNRAEASVRPALPPTVIEIDSAPPPPPPPAPKAEPLAPEETAPAAPLPQAAKPVAPRAPQAAAQAGRVLTAADEAPGVADFTMVQGVGAYAGGITSSSGTSKSAVTSAPASGPAPGPVAGAGGDGTRPTGPDLSKPARPVGSDWDCKALFPREATSDNATVLIVARVRPDGAPESVSVVKDPGEGFGRAARACAMRQRYAAAEDRDGHAVLATTAPFRVRFTR